jgi:hypothetical protein
VKIEGRVNEAIAYRADTEIERFIEKRAAGRDPDEERRQIYAASVERYRANEEAELRAEWIAHHETQAERLESTAAALAAEHRAKAERLREEAHD